jgi:anti-sigma B factor antagonist
MDFRLDDYALDGRTHCIEVAGQLDLYSAPSFKQRILGAIEQGTTRVIVDLSAVSFIDSSALGVFVAALTRIRARQGVLSVVVTDYDLERLLEISGLDGLLSVHRSRDDALQHLRRPRRSCVVPARRPGRCPKWEGGFAQIASRRWPQSSQHRVPDADSGRTR